MDTLRAREARRLELSKRQRSIVVGSLLGDGYLVQTTRGYAFRVNHSPHQKRLVDWKYRELESFTNSGPRKSGNCYYFRTVIHPTFADLRRSFYDDSRKILPELISDWIDELSLAVWIMDDGSRDANGIRINTQSFSLVENEMLADILRAKFGIVARINRDKDRFRLRVSAKSTLIVKQLVAPHIIPDMLYKLSL